MVHQQRGLALRADGTNCSTARSTPSMRGHGPAGRRRPLLAYAEPKFANPRISAVLAKATSPSTDTSRNIDGAAFLQTGLRFATGISSHADGMQERSFRVLVASRQYSGFFVRDKSLRPHF